MSTRQVQKAVQEALEKERMKQKQENESTAARLQDLESQLKAEQKARANAEK